MVFLLLDPVQVTGLLLVWNLAVVHNISKWFYQYSKRFTGVPSEYVGRKVVHILSGGVTTVVISMFYADYYWLVTLLALMLAGYLYFRRRRGLMYWFQIENNSFEIHFAIMFGIVLMVGAALGDIWIGLLPMLFMSFGDSATGLVRAFTQKRQVKSWDGTAAMFIVCAILGFWRLSWYGVFIATVASLVERIPKLDDNITVPLVVALLVYLGRLI